MVSSVTLILQWMRISCEDHCFDGRIHLKLRLGGSSGGGELGLHDVADVASGLVEVEGHALGTEVAGDDVELDAVLVDHVGHSAEKIKSAMVGYE